MRYFGYSWLKKFLSALEASKLLTKFICYVSLLQLIISIDLEIIIIIIIVDFFVASIGGIFSLFLGCSILSIFEIIYFLVILLVSLSVSRNR